MKRRDSGVTLVELLVVVALMGILVPPLVGALAVGWQTTDDTVGRLSDNRNRALSASLFTNDVQTAEAVDTASGDTTCLVAGDTLVVRFRWTETPASGPATNRVSSWVVVGGPDPTVQRRFCATGTTVTSTVVVAHGVAGTPTVTCRDAGGSAVACAAAVIVDLGLADSSGSFAATGRRRTS